VTDLPEYRIALSQKGRARSPNEPQSTASSRGSIGGFDKSSLPQRRKLPHEIPVWAQTKAIYFVTICVEPKGRNHFCLEKTAHEMWTTVLHRQEIGQWWVHLFLMMPDHIHALMSFAPDPGMKATISAWKRYTARQYGISWQRDFFDHRLRKDESLVEKSYYIRLNPVRKGLVNRSEDWPFVWEMRL